MSHRTAWLMYCVLVLLMCVVSVKVALAADGACSGGCCQVAPAVPCTDVDCSCDNISRMPCNATLPDECH